MLSNLLLIPPQQSLRIGLRLPVQSHRSRKYFPIGRRDVVIRSTQAIHTGLPIFEALSKLLHILALDRGKHPLGFFQYVLTIVLFHVHIPAQAWLTQQKSSNNRSCLHFLIIFHGLIPCVAQLAQHVGHRIQHGLIAGQVRFE